MALLETRALTKSFGGLLALDSIALHVDDGEIVSLIGPNGAGKTTLFNCLTGIHRPTAGDIVFRGASLVRCRPSRISTLGIARTFQNIRLFYGMSVLDNVQVGRHALFRTGMLDAVLQTPAARAEEAESVRLCRDLLGFVGLEGSADRQASVLSYGEQKKLEIARALASKPGLLLLDEPAAGMNPTETRSLMDLIRKIRQRGTTILLIEHDMKMVMDISDRVCVLDYGEKIAEGAPRDIQTNPLVIEAYLGTTGAGHAGTR